MINILTGANSLLLKQELKKITDIFLEEHGDIALERIDGEEASFERLQESLTSAPFLASKKMVVLRAPSANKQFAESIDELIKGLPESTDLVIVEPKLDKRLQYYKLLRKQPDFKEFTELDALGLSSWLSASATQKGGTLSTSDARYLVDRVGQNQQALSTDLDKLLTYDSKITRANIDLLTDAAPQSTIFELLESVFAGKTKRAMDLYAEQRSLKVEPQQIIAMLGWQLNVLAILKTAGDKPIEDIAKEAKLNPFVLRKSTGIARKLSLTELKEQISSLVKIDMQSKRTNLDLDEALQHYLLKLANL